MMSRIALGRLVLACTLALAAGCASTRSVSLPVRGVAPLNPNEAQESTPVDVRVWPLAAAERFKAATVEQVWTDAKGALGGDLLGDPATFTVFPGAAGDPAVVQRLEMPGGTRFLGVLAMYQRSDAQDQRATVVPVEDAEDHGLLLSGFAVRIDRPAPAAP
jgi:type VI secretion system VasD/TssJ family lipoprotein